MQLTLQFRVRDLSAETLRTFDALGDYHGHMLRELYAYVAKHGGPALRHKTAFCREYGISARLFNSLRTEIDGLIKGTTELLTTQRDDLKKSIKSLYGKLKRLEQFFGKIEQDQLRVKSKTSLKKRAQQARAKAKLTKARHKLAGIDKRLAARVPGICFGSRKLFMKQFHLKENGYRSRKEWLADWHAARSHQCFFLGSKDETGGNQQCTLSEAADGSLSLRIRIPDALLKSGDKKYVVVPNVRLPFGDDALRAALEAGQALTWRMHRDSTGWRFFVAFERPARATRTVQVLYGAVGADFNSDHIAVTVVDANGNFSKLATRRLELPFEGRSSGQRAAILADALEDLVSLADKLKLPLVIEDLDFKEKKKQLGKMSPAQARALSGLVYAQFTTLLESKCHLRGIALVKVNPAYTSVAGRIKYATSKGLSVHHAAAGVIARRAQGCTERLSRARELRIPAHGTTLSFPLPARKDGASKGAAWKRVTTALTGFLRKSFKPTRSAARLRSAQGRTSARDLSLTHPERGRRGPAAQSNCESEQICSSFN
jgi:IS605 OrfB family transposase